MSENRHYSHMRCQVVNAYPGKKWAKKVEQMSDEQIYRIFVSLRQRATEQYKREEKKR